MRAKMLTSREETSVPNASSDSQNSFPYYFRKRRNRRRSSLLRRECRIVRRLVRKSGKLSVYQENQSNRLYRYFLDLSNTVINSQWKWTVLLLSLAFILIWFVFACLWMLIGVENEDYGETEQCLTGIQGFRGYLLFSIETQSSIGYGTRYINHYCPEAIFLMCVQIGTGICIGGSLICIVYAKMIGPHRLHSLNCFSKHAVINQRDGVLCLMFRIRDSSGRYQCLTKVSAYLVQRRKEDVCLKSIKLDPVGILIWPVEVVHQINESSPFWDLSAKDLIIKRFELIIEMEGTSSTTSNPSKTLTSYLSREILWGHRFQPCIDYDIRKSSYVVSDKLFNKTKETITPLCSAKRLAQVLREVSVVEQPNLTNDIPSPVTSTVRSSLGYGSLSSTAMSPVTVHVENFEKHFVTEKMFSISPTSSEPSTDEENEFTCEGLCTKELSRDDLYKSLEQFVVVNSGSTKNVIDRHHIDYNETAF